MTKGGWGQQHCGRTSDGLVTIWARQGDLRARMCVCVRVCVLVWCAHAYVRVVCVCVGMYVSLAARRRSQALARSL